MRPIRSSALALLAAGLIALAGCGGDDEEDTSAATTTEAPAATTDEATTEATTEETTEATETRESETEEERESPEDAEGGAGDEEPIRTEAEITGSGGRLTPRRVRVPAFIAVRVRLRSADGGSYTLKLGGETLRVNSGNDSDEATLEGLRPGRSYRGGGVTIEATAEPGP